MSICIACGLALSGDRDFCPHHPTDHDEEWNVINRVMCDFVHRKWLPPQPPPLPVLRMSVVEALATAGLSAIKVDIDDFDLAVTIFLSGAVSSEDEARQAKRIAASVYGVEKIIGNVTIKPSMCWRRLFASR